MVDRYTHYVGGFLFVFGALVYFNKGYGWKYDALTFILALGIGVLFSRLPDVLEPPNGNHRSFFHSYFVFVFLGGLLYLLHNMLIVGIDTTLFYLFFVSLGYESHLVLDLPNLPIII